MLWGKHHCPHVTSEVLNQGSQSTGQCLGHLARKGPLKVGSRGLAGRGRASGQG